jgi:5'-nucleotidase/UDP-sugar diphosphatase
MAGQCGAGQIPPLPSKERVVKKVYAAIAIVAGLAAGCATDKKPASAEATPGALDVMPANEPTPMPVLAANAPVPSSVIAAPDTVTTQTPVSSAAGASYTVKKGDTLYKLAREHYGDGKQWQRIASANPGLSPQSLRVGQTLIIP